MIKLGIIGMGDMGSNYTRMILQHPELGIEIVAITRVKEKNLAKFKEFMKNEFKIYQSDEEFFAAFDKGEFSIDAVLVVTPHYKHEFSVKEAFKRNLHVLCDKPAGVYLRQGREMLEAKPQDKSYGFIFHQRQFPINQKLKEIIDSKIYGKIKRVSYIMSDWYRTNAYYKSAAWRSTYKTDGGGTLLNQCPHSIDLLCWLVGMPKSITAFCSEGKYHDIEVEDEATVYIQWPENVTGVFIASTGETPGVNRLEISFERAVVSCSKDELHISENQQPEIYYRNQESQYIKIDSTSSSQSYKNESDTAYLEVLSAFAKSAKNNGCVTAPGEESLASLYFANAAYLSSAEHRTIKVSKIGTPEELQFEKDFESWLKSKCE